MAADKLTGLRTQRRNANKHTQRGLGMLEKSIQQDGWVGAITVAADGETFDGSARIDVGVASGFDDAIVVESDGSRPVVVRRTDIPNADHPRAVRLGIAANRVASVDLDWSVDVLAELNTEGLLDGLFFENEIDRLLGQVQPIDPNELWKGMPEFENEEDSARALRVYFPTLEDYAHFCDLLGLKSIGKATHIWFPNPPERTKYDMTKNES